MAGSGGAPLRREKLQRLSTETFDLLVVGGGINGAGIAREAALRGLKTALVEKGDFASGTSSRSSKLIHGGFRYLEQGDILLVLEASRERDLLRRRLAPHLVRPLPFFFPIYRGGPVGLWKLRAGLAAYDLLAAFRNIERHRVAGAARARELEPELRTDGLRGGAVYWDCMTDDARLVLETILAAESAGAVCLNYVALEAFEKSAGKLAGAILQDLEAPQAVLAVRARSVVNATGPWLDRVRMLDDQRARPLLRVTKGAHMVVPRDRVGNRHAVVLQAVADRRILFVIPWEEHALVGTTDTDFEGSPDAVEADSADVEYLLETVNFHFPRSRLTEGDVISTFAGLRPLIAGSVGEAPSDVSREEEIVESPSGLVSLGGGKLTTYRRVAIKVVNRVARRLEAEHGTVTKSSSGTDRLPLPGGGDGAVSAEAAGVPRETAEFLASRYGVRAREVMRLLGGEPDLARSLVPGSPHVRGEVSFAAASEMALRVEDVLRRRTQVALKTHDRGTTAAEDAATLMAAPLGWDAETISRRARDYRSPVETSSAREPRRRKA